MNGGGFSNISWIPFIIHGKGLEPVHDTTTAAQIDIAPTVLELAGFAVPNIFMGHNLLRDTETILNADSTIVKKERAGLSLGAYSGYSALGLDNYRVVSKTGTNDEVYLFADSDLRQEHDLAKTQSERTAKMHATLDSLIKISDYSLEHGL